MKDVTRARSLNFGRNSQPTLNRFNCCAQSLSIFIFAHFQNLFILWLSSSWASGLMQWFCRNDFDSRSFYRLVGDFCWKIRKAMDFFFFSSSSINGTPPKQQFACVIVLTFTDSWMLFIWQHFGHYFVLPDGAATPISHLLLHPLEHRTALCAILAFAICFYLQINLFVFCWIDFWNFETISTDQSSDKRKPWHEQNQWRQFWRNAFEEVAERFLLRQTMNEWMNESPKK